MSRVRFSPPAPINQSLRSALPRWFWIFRRFSGEVRTLFVQFDATSQGKHDRFLVDVSRQRPLYPILGPPQYVCDIEAASRVPLTIVWWQVRPPLTANEIYAGAGTSPP